MSLNPARGRMVAIGNMLEAHASQFNYSEGPDRAEVYDLTPDELLVRLDAGETITGDCSSTAEAARKDADCVNLPPLGWTGIELETMPHIALADALEGDFVVFGAPPGKHVVWIAGAHPTNPTVHGHLNPALVVDGHGEPGFTQGTLQDLWDAVFPGQPITVLSLAPFLPKSPTPPKEEVVAPVAAAAGSDGRVHVFQETSDGTVYGSTQVSPGGSFSVPFVVMKDGKAPAKGVEAPVDHVEDLPDEPNPGEPQETPVPESTPVAPEPVVPAPESAPEPAPVPEAPVEPTPEAPAEPVAPEPVAPEGTLQVTVSLDGGGNGWTNAAVPFSLVTGASSLSPSPGNVGVEPVADDPSQACVRVTGGQPGSNEVVLVSHA